MRFNNIVELYQNNVSKPRNGFSFSGRSVFSECIGNPTRKRVRVKILAYTSGYHIFSFTESEGNRVDEFRPEYVEALDAARWNYWWYLSLAIPFLLLVPAAVKRKFGCLAISATYFLTWLTLNLCIQHYWAAKKINAVTEAEWADVTADTGRVFAGISTIPYVFVDISVIAVLIYSIAGVLRYCFGKSNDTRPNNGKPKKAKPKRREPVRVNPWTD